MEDRWLTYAKRLQALAGSGLYFSRDEFDRERFQEVAEIAGDMMADLASVPVEALKDLMPDFAKGYSTPTLAVRAALIEDGRILLVREKVDGLWTMPGGYTDVAMSAAENAVKEFQEEAGVTIRADRLIAVLHKAKWRYPPDLREFYKFFFLCSREDRSDPVAGSEVSDVGFFPPDALPPLSRGRSNEDDVARAFAYAADPDRPVLFD